MLTSASNLDAVRVWSLFNTPFRVQLWTLRPFSLLGYSDSPCQSDYLGICKTYSTEL